MSDQPYTPTTSQVRSVYAVAVGPLQFAERESRFDRWLAEHDAARKQQLATVTAQRDALLAEISRARGISLDVVRAMHGITATDGTAPCDRGPCHRPHGHNGTCNPGDDGP